MLGELEGCARLPFVVVMPTISSHLESSRRKVAEPLHPSLAGTPFGVLLKSATGRLRNSVLAIATACRNSERREVAVEAFRDSVGQLWVF
jgi:hypothetical protein